MDCPNCQVKMKELTAPSHYGAKIFIDQCPSCGGLWFDDMEMYHLPKAVAETIDRIDVAKLNESAFINPQLFCPKDKTELKLFSDRNFPAEIKVESCPRCGGFWFNRGEFKQFSDKRAEKTKERKEKEKDVLSSQIGKMLAAESTAPLYNAVGHLGRFLSRPYYQGTGGIAPVELAEESNEERERMRRIMEAIGYVILFLLRLFMRR